MPKTEVRIAVDLRDLLCCVRRFLGVLHRDFLQAFFAHRFHIDGRGEGDQALVGADVRGRFFAADVLFAGRKRQHKTAIAVFVVRDAASRPGIWRTNFSCVANSPTCGPPKLIGMPNDWPSPTTMSAPHSPGDLSRPNEIASVTTTMNKCADGVSCVGQSRSRSSMQPKKFGDWTTSAAVLSSRADKIGDASGFLVKIDFDYLGVAVLRISSGDFAIFRMDALCDDDLVAARHALCHQICLGHRGRAVVHRGVRDLHSGKLADQRLEFENVLQCALRDLGLIRRVRCKKFGPLDQMIDDRRRIMRINAGAEKRRLCAAVFFAAIASIAAMTSDSASGSVMFERPI